MNKQNHEFMQDVHEAFDKLDREFPHKPAILTANGKVFSAGIDFDYCFPMFERGDQTEIAEWFTEYRKCMLRIFTSPRMTIAAVNGHAFAGGFILSLACDFRVVAKGEFRYALNEVPIGIPMPSVYNEILRYRLGSALTNEAVLLGKTYSVEDGYRLGFFSNMVELAEIVPAALKLAGTISPNCWLAYAQTKQSLLYPVMQAIESFTAKLDVETFKVMASKTSIAAQRVVYEALKNKKR